MTVQAPPRGPEHDPLQALIEEARQRARKRRRRNGALAVAVALLLAGAGVLAVELLGSPAGAARSDLPRSAPAPLAVGKGPFWYTRTLGTMRVPRCATPLRGIMNRCAATVWFEVVMSTETWIGTDGTMRQRSVEVSQRFASDADRTRWLHRSHSRVPVPISVAQGDALDIGSGHFPSPAFEAIAPDVPPQEGPPTGVGPIDVGDGLFTYRQLVGLPAGGRAALARIDQAWAALRHRYGMMLLRWHSPGAAKVARDDLAPLPRAGRSIQELLAIAQLDAAPVPRRVRRALAAAAAALPGVTVHGSGPRAFTVSAAYAHWQPASVTFDARSGEVLTGQPWSGGPPDIAGPASRVVAQGRVASIYALPAGVAWIRGVAAPPIWPSPPVPAAESVSPAIGGPRSVLTVLVAAEAGERAHPAPTAWMGISDSGGQGTFESASRSFDRCLPPNSVRVWPARTIKRAGALVFVYRVVPRQFHLRAWCPGRYQLGVQSFPNPLPPHFTTPPYTGASGTSTYFRIR